MSDTPNIGFPLLEQAQAQKEVTVNESLVILDVLLGGVVSRTETAPPGSPAAGDGYIVASPATGLWAGHEDDIAYYFGGVWLFLSPEVGAGHQVWVDDELLFLQYGVGSPSGWNAADTSLGDVVGPASAVNNRLAQFDGTSGKLLEDSGVSISTDGTLATNSDALVPTEKAVKTYVDAKVAGLSWKQAVRAATTVAGTLATSFENGDTVDGVVLATGDRILIKNQAAPADNGIYVVAASGAPARSTDADSGVELVNASVYVSEGTTLADTQWTCTTNAPITVGSTSLAFAQLTSGGGNSFVTVSVSGQSDVVADSSNDTLTLVAGSNITITTNAGTDTVTIAASGGGSFDYQWVPAGAITPSVTGGCQSLTTIASASGQPDIQTLNFDGTTQEFGQFSLSPPAGWSAGTVTFEPVWSHAATVTNFGVYWTLQAVAISNDDTILANFGTLQSSTDTGGTTDDVYNGPASSAITIAGTPAVGDTVFFRVSRDPTNGSDTMTIDARLHGLRVFFA